MMQLQVFLKNGNNEFVLAAGIKSNAGAWQTGLLNYSLAGQLQWSHLYEDTLQLNRKPTDMAIDFLGNIYVPFNCEQSGAITANVLKVNQPTKCLPVLKKYLKKLAVGLLDVSSDSIVKSIFYESCNQAIDSFYFIGYKDLIEKCALRNLDLKAAMNTKIAAFYNLPAYNYVDFIFEHFWLVGFKQNPLLAIPHYHHFNATQLLDNPKLAYSLDDRDYPIPCINCGGATIDKAGTETYRTWITMITAPWWYYQNGSTLVYITNCSGRFSALGPNDDCGICMPNPVGAIPQGPSSSAGNYEIRIELSSEGSVGDDGCYNPIVPLYPILPIPPALPQPTAFARITTIFDVPHYLFSGYNLPFAEKIIKKMQHAIVDRLYYFPNTQNPTIYVDENDIQNVPNNWLKGDILSLCQPSTEFDEILGGVSRYTLAYGIYKLDRPGVNSQRPLYFAFPYLQNLWYSGGPDMGLNYGTDVDLCGNWSYRPLKQDNFTRHCLFCDFGSKSLDISPLTDIRELIATTDYATFANYWLDNVITVGFSTDYGTLPCGNDPTFFWQHVNLHTFNAEISPTTTNTPTFTTLLTTLSLNSSGEYTVSKLFDAGASVPATNQVEICIKAKFKNGETIDECRQVTLVDTNPLTPGQVYKYVIVDVRGNIEDYSSSITNYEIKIYKQ